MKLFELFDNAPHGGTEDAGDDEFYVSKKIGAHEISFGAGEIGRGVWEVEFINTTGGGSGHAKTGDGHEIEVMAFVMNSMRRFMSKYKPKRIQFSSKSTEENRTNLYKRMVDRYAKDYYVQLHKGVGMGSAEKYDHFDLIRKADEEQVNELFNTKHGDDKTSYMPGLYMAACQKIGDREITFNAESPKEDGNWTVDFHEESKDESGFAHKDWGLTKSGDEIKVFSFVVDQLRVLVKKEKPASIKFSADKADGNRANLYKRMAERLAKQHGYTVNTRNKTHRDMSVTNFTLVREGQMKRSDPWISGEKDGARTEPAKKYPAPKMKEYDTKIVNLAKRAKISPDKVEIAWDQSKAEVDSKLPNYWAIVMNHTKKKIGIKE